MASSQIEARRRTRARKSLVFTFLFLVSAFVARAIPVTINASPANGRAFTVAGSGCQPGGYTTPQTLEWTPGASCTVAFISPHSDQVGTQYTFIGWQDAVSSATRVISTPAQASTYTAVFSRQYYLSFQVTPEGGGTVSGGGWTDAGSVVNLTATAASGYRFVDWEGVDSIGPSASAGVTVYAARTVTANFVAITNSVPSAYVAVPVLSGYLSGSPKINDYGQIAGVANQPFLWTPVSANEVVGSVALLRDALGTPQEIKGLNGRGQILVNSLGTQGTKTVLWSPSTPNGLQGTNVTISESNGTFALNEYGQVAGPGYLWTPTTANGQSGTRTTNIPFATATGMVMNGYGQIAAVQGSEIMLFTPSVRNGTTGIIASLQVLPSRGYGYGLAGITSDGSVVGLTSTTSGLQTFVWKPTAANASTGLATPIVIPSGFSSMTPLAVNDAGDVVGYMTTGGSFTSTPFLYKNGTVYDLTTASVGLRGGTAYGINNKGQIVVVNGPYVFLVTPAAETQSPPSSAVAVTINAGPASGRAFTVAGAGCQPGGYTTPRTLQWTPGASCTIAFISPHSDEIGTQYKFIGWQDASSSATRVISTPAQATTYTAVFSRQYYLTVQVTPQSGGTVSGGGWIDPGAVADLTATAADGYRFVDWTGVDSSPTSGSATVTVTSARSVTANFAAIANSLPSAYSAVSVLSGYVFGYLKINDYGQIAGSLSRPFLWTPASPNGVVGSATLLQDALGSDGTIAGLNGRGQILANIQGTQGTKTVLWSPSAPNGLQGMRVTISEASGAVALNEYGQIAGSGYLWTPAAANGQSGSMTTNDQFASTGRVVMNGYGQTALSQGSGITLFTPSARNGTNGTFTSLQGLPSSAYGYELAGIASDGRVVGYTRRSGGSQTFVWTPTAANGSAGLVTQIALPNGISSMVPVAVNDAGDIVGYMQTPGSVTLIPFLYKNGTLYDLTAISGVLRGGTANAVNNKGQIVIVNDSTVYLLSPATETQSPPPSNAVAITISASPLSGRAFTVVSSGCQPGGYTTPRTLQWTPGASCTVAFISPQSDQVVTQYAFIGWQDGISTATRVISTPAQPTTYTAVFNTQHYLTVQINPPSGGTVSGGGWITAGSVANLSATAASGYRFVDWTGVESSPASGSATVTVSYPRSVTASFAAITNSLPGYSAVPVVSSVNVPNPPKINDYGQIAGVGSMANQPFLWTPASANGIVGTTRLLQDAIGTPRLISGLNDRGQILANITTTQGTKTVLWSPSAPNGWQGTSVTISEVNAAFALNEYGQIAGNGYLWTPAAANGQAGTMTTNDQFASAGTGGMNGYGQIVFFQNSAFTLFTPSARNGTNGTFTILQGLPSAGYGYQLAGITGDGSVVGAAARAGGTQAFIWKPTTANGSIGLATEIAFPSGFSSMYPMAVNDAGDVVGYMAATGGSAAIPFLYKSGTVYDLTAISGALRGGTAYGINNKGQIVVASGTVIYLVSPPAPANPDGEVSITISSSVVGATFVADGATYTSPQVFRWVPDSLHSIAFSQTTNITTAQRSAFQKWTDGITTASRSIQVPSQAAEYTASFVNEYKLTAAPSPSGGGTLQVVPLSADGFYASGTPVRLTATPSAGYIFSGYSGGLSGTSPILDFQITQPTAVSANFLSTNGGGCTFDVPKTISVPQAGTARTITLIASSQGCSWTASSNASWAQIFPLSGTGSAELTLVVYPNNTTQLRSATLTIGQSPTQIEQSPSALSDDERFVSQLYFMFLGRVPAMSEVSWQVTEGLRKGQTRADIAMNFMNSAEFNQTGRFVAGLYVGLLDRDAEYSGWLFQRNALANGVVSQLALASNFLNSDEYRLRFGAPNNREYVTLLYRKVLLREPTPDEVTFQASALAGGVPRVSLASSFLNSAEFRISTGPRLSAFLLYATLLQRDARGDERTTRIQQINGGMPLRTLADQFINSVEFANSLR